MTKQQPQLWERYEKESSKAYAAFCIYRDLGVDRSYEQVQKKCGKSARLIARWGSKYNWVARCQAYDDHLLNETQKAFEKRILKFKDQRSKEALEIANKAFESMQSDNIGSKEARKRWELGVDKFMQILGLDKKDVKIEHDGEIKITINPKVEP